MCLGWRDSRVLHFQVKRELQAFGKDRWDSGLHIFRSEPAPVPSMQGGTSYTLEERSGPCEFSSWPRHGAGILLASSDSEEPSALTVLTASPPPNRRPPLRGHRTRSSHFLFCSFSLRGPLKAPLTPRPQQTTKHHRTSPVPLRSALLQSWPSPSRGNVSRLLSEDVGTRQVGAFWKKP